MREWMRAACGETNFVRRQREIAREERGCGSSATISSSGTSISNSPNRPVKCMCELFHLSIEAGGMIPCKAKQKHSINSFHFQWHYHCEPHRGTITCFFTSQSNLIIQNTVASCRRKEKIKQMSAALNRRMDTVRS